MSYTIFGNDRLYRDFNDFAEAKEKFEQPPAAVIFTFFVATIVKYRVRDDFTCF